MESKTELRLVQRVRGLVDSTNPLSLSVDRKPTRAIE